MIHGGMINMIVQIKAQVGRGLFQHQNNIGYNKEIYTEESE